MNPELFDVVRLLKNLPEYGLRKGRQGTIVHCLSRDIYEVEFSNEFGETETLCPLTPDQFQVVWKAATQNWMAEVHAE
jgi:hypothetical protein